MARSLLKTPFSAPFTFSGARFCCQNLISSTTRFLSTSIEDGIEGLFDPGDPFSARVSQVESVLEDEFAFLRDSFIQSAPPEKQIDASKSSDDAAMIANAILFNNDDFGDKTQKFLRQNREKMKDNLVAEVLNLIRKPELGIKFFLWVGRQIGYSHTLPVYNALLDLIECRNSDRIPEHFLSEIRDDDKEVLGKLLSILIQRCCRNEQWNIALEELGRLKDMGYKPSRRTYCALVQVFLRANRLDTAHLVQREMSDAGFRMDGYTLGCYTHSLCKEGKWREALWLIEKEEFKPDTVLYTKMISGLCDASLFEEAMEFLSRMHASNCIPNDVTFRTLLCGCLRKKQLGRCKRILSMMMTEGCYPSPRIFDSLVHAFCRSRDYAYAYKLLKKMAQCGCQPGYVVYNILIGSICSDENLPSSDVLELAEKSYCEMLDAGIVLNKINASNFARCLCAAGKFEKAYKIIHGMMSKGFIPDSSTYSKVIEFLCNYRKVEKAFQLFDEMKKNGLVPDVYTYTTLIDSFCKSGLIEQASKWFAEMESSGCTPNVVTYTALIHAYLKARKASKADELFQKMLSQGCKPNTVTYTALIDGHCKAGQIEKACQIYARMHGDVETSDVDMYFSVVDGESKEPNVYTYGALVNGLCKVYKVKEARDLLDAMAAVGCVPNQILYDALIDGFCKVGKLEEAQEVFAKMSEHGYSADVYTYSSLIDRLFKDKRSDLALKVLSKMLENSIAPNVVIYTEIVDGLCKSGKTDEANKLMFMMEEKGCHPNVVTYTAIIDGFGKEGKIDKCLELLRQMRCKGCAPNFITYSVLIKHCCVAGFLDEACELLDEMKQTYWPKHILSYRKVIEGFNREFIMCLGILDEMNKAEFPVVPVYRILIDNLVKAEKLEVALELYKEIESFSSFSAADMNINQSLIGSLSLAGKVNEAFELYGNMVKKGGVPELSIFVHLIKGLIKINKWEEALLLSDRICQMDIQWLQEK